MSSPFSEASSEATTNITTMAEQLDQKQSTTLSPNERSDNLQVDLNLKATELRLGPPGSISPERHMFPADEFVGKYNLGFLKNSAKRGFSDVKSDNSVLAGNPDLEQPNLPEKKPQNHNSSTSLHASKAQVVGWPPIRSFRKNTMATNPPKTDNNPGNKPEASGCVYVKVSMDNAPYLRKVDLTIYCSYAELSSALEKMFSCFTIGQYGYNGVPGRDGLSLSESRLKDLQNSEQCVLIYEDKDGDWMLVGDVPWDMFTNTCRRIRITKSSEAIGLGKNKE